MNEELAAGLAAALGSAGPIEDEAALEPWPIEDEAALDERRAAVGLEPMCAYAALNAGCSSSAQTARAVSTNARAAGDW